MGLTEMLRKTGKATKNLGKKFAGAVVYAGAIAGFYSDTKNVQADPIHFFQNTWSTDGYDGFWASWFSNKITEIFVANGVPIHDTSQLRANRDFSRFDILVYQTINPSSSSCNFEPYANGEIRVMVYDWEGVDIDVNSQPTVPVPIISDRRYVIRSPSFPSCGTSIAPYTQPYFDLRNNLDVIDSIPAVSPVGMVVLGGAVVAAGGVLIRRKAKLAREESKSKN
ncbi:hypothetical protein HYV50_05235 [Candidatus Pacearchaeota archaeon]|nr:hypothetical protein [Candidatus Pacearchaeota archaeon]